MERCIPRVSLSALLLLLISTSASLVAAHQHTADCEGIHRRSSGQAPKSILDQSIKALGGQVALANAKTVSSHAFIWRSFSVAESNVPGVADTGISVAGEQTISYDLSDPSTVVQRIDRKDVLGDYWTFQRTLLDVPQSSLVVRSGLDGYACYTSGNTFLFAPPEVPFGYTDPFYAYVLVRDAWRQSPALVLSFLASNGTLSSTNVKVNGGRDHPAVFDSSRNLTIIFDPDTYLPARIRAYENHPILGPSTNDVMYYNYTTVSGIKFAQNMKMLYNDNLMIQEVLYDTFTVNGNVSSTFFEGLPSAISNETFTGVPPAPAQYSEIFSPAQIFEFSQNFFYAGPYAGKLSNMTVIKPIPSLPNLWHLTFNDNTVYRTTVAVFDDAIMVTDAPPQQSLLVIEWVKEKFNRPVTHLLVTHHHHDHNLGAVDYVNQGAKLVVPARFSYYWDEIEGVQFETADEDQPFTYKDSKMQVQGVWHAVDAHSADWMYFTFTCATPSSNSTMGVVTADAWSPGVDPFGYGQRPVEQWLAIARADGVPKQHMELPIHGTPLPASLMYPTIGYEYPDHTLTDFKYLSR